MRLNKNEDAEKGSSDSNVLSVHTVRHAVSVGELNEDGGIEKQLKSLSSANMSTLEENKSDRNLWNKLRKDRLKALAMAGDSLNSDSGSSDDITKKSFKRKISGMFRPRSSSASFE